VPKLYYTASGIVTKLYYTASGIITPIGVKIVLYSLWYYHTYRCQNCIIQPLVSSKNCIIQPLVSSHLLPEAV